MNLNRVDSVLVTNTGGANTGTTLQNIIDGDVLVFNKNNTNLTGTPTPTSAVGNEEIYLAQGLPLVDSKNQFRASARIKANKITSWKKQAFAAPVQQVMHFGFNGTSGALALKDSTSYRFRLHVTNSRHVATPHEPPSYSFFLDTASSADNFEGAANIAAKLNIAAARKDRRGRFLGEVISSGALTELTVDAIVVNGNTLVTTIGAHGVAAGALVAFRSIVYKVRTVPTTATMTLDRAYSGVSETFDVSATVDLAATVAAGDIGLRVTALVITTRDPDTYQQTTFDAAFAVINGSPADAADFEAKTNVAAIRGQGFFEQVRDLEFFAAGYRGITNRIDFPIDAFTAIAVAGATYRVYVIEHFDNVNVAHGEVNNPIQTLVAFDISSATTKADAFEGILDSYMVAAGLPAVP